MSRSSDSVSNSARSDVSNIFVEDLYKKGFGRLTVAVVTPWARVHGRSASGHSVLWGHLLMRRWLSDSRRCSSSTVTDSAEWTIFRSDCVEGEPPHEVEPYDPASFWRIDGARAVALPDIEASLRRRLAGEVPLVETAADQMAKCLFYGATAPSLDLGKWLRADADRVEQRWSTRHASTLERQCGHALSRPRHPRQWPTATLPFERALVLVARRACVLDRGAAHLHAGQLWRIEVARLRRAEDWKSDIAELRARHPLVCRDPRMRGLSLAVQRELEPAVERTRVSPAPCLLALLAAARGPRLGNQDRWLLVQQALAVGMSPDSVRSLLRARAHRVYEGREVALHVREADDMVRRAEGTKAVAGCRAMQGAWCPFAALGGVDKAREACGRRAPYLEPEGPTRAPARPAGP